MRDNRNILSAMPSAGALTRHGERVTSFAAVVMLMIFLSHQPAAAEVLEIGPGGAVTVYDTPSVVTAEGTRPIAPPMPAARVAAAPVNIRQFLATAAHRYALSEELLNAVARQESHFRADAISAKGAVGPMQLMAGTAHDLGVDRYDPSQNILGGAAYLRRMLDHFHGNVSLALAAYNAGPGAVERSGGIPHFLETHRYVDAILGQTGQGIPASSLIINR
jgi:hypothetical protein